MRDGTLRQLLKAKSARVVEDARMRRRVADLEDALQPFAREHTHAEIAPRAAFAHAAELLADRRG